MNFVPARHQFGCLGLLILATMACAGGGKGSDTPTNTPTPVLTTVTVTPSAGASGNLVAGQSLQLAVSTKDQSGNTISATVSWSSSATTVATVSGTGLVSAVGPGTATITATAIAGSTTRTSNFSVTVTAAPILTSVLVTGSTSVTVGQATQLSATPRDQNAAAMTASVTWSSSAPSVASVSGTGLVTGATVGTATITATATAGSITVLGTAVVTVSAVIPELTTVNITPATTSISAGSTLQLTAASLDQNGNPIAASVTWSTTNASVATVSQTGLVTGVANGSAVISAQATASGKTVTATRALTVTTAAPVLTSVQISGGTTVNVGSTLQLTATPRDENGNPISATVTWSSSNQAQATVSANGLVSGVAIGTPNITANATLGSAQVSNFITITVNAAAFPSNASVSTTAGNTFSPASVDIASGGTVDWTGLLGHDVTFSGAAPPGGNITGTASGSRTFGPAGSYPYICSIHGASMSGTVIVH